MTRNFFSEKHRKAIGYAHLGIHIFPLLPNTKKPIHKGGYKIASITPRQIDEWWSEHPDANIGAWPGASGHCVIDVDLKPSEDGNLSLQCLENVHGPVPVTMETSTISGGRHLWFEGNLKFSIKQLGPGLDTIGVKGYVVMPGSSIGGKCYREVIGIERITQIPNWVSKCLGRKERSPSKSSMVHEDEPSNVDRAISYLKGRVFEGDVAVENQGGGRRAFQVSATLRDLGISEDKAIDLFMEHYNEHCEPPWSEDELTSSVGSIVRNAYRYAQNEPGSLALNNLIEKFTGIQKGHRSKTSRASAGRAESALPSSRPGRRSLSNEWSEPVDLFNTLALPELPLELLPRTIKHFAEQEAELLGADPGGIATAALTVVASAVRDAHVVQVKKHDTSWKERACIWSMLSGRPSTMKTPIISSVTRQLKIRQSENFETYRKACQGAETKGKIETEPPHRLFVNDATMEALQVRMAENPHGLLTLQDELAGWITSFDRYSPNKNAKGERTFCLSTWNGGPYVIDRISRGITHIENASMSVLGGIQPEIISDVTANMGDDGLLQRFLICNLRPSKQGADRKRDPRIDQGIKRLIDALVDDDCEPRNHVFDSEARVVVNDFLGLVHDLQALEEHSSKLATWCGKLGAQMARLAMTLHYANADGKNVPIAINAETAQQAVSLLEVYYLPHAINFFTKIIGDNATDDKARWIADHILAHRLTRVTFRDLDRGGVTVKNTSDQERRKYFRLLESYGWVLPETEIEAICNAWKVNPAVHNLFEQRGKLERVRRKKAAEMIRKTTRMATSSLDD
jgi:Protein of unknown function (DUF3987)/Bifunctional DNA primase/polymerase, N-terminal